MVQVLLLFTGVSTVTGACLKQTGDTWDGTDEVTCAGDGGSAGEWGKQCMQSINAQGTLDQQCDGTLIGDTMCEEFGLTSGQPCCTEYSYQGKIQRTIHCSGADGLTDPAAVKTTLESDQCLKPCISKGDQNDQGLSYDGDCLIISTSGSVTGLAKCDPKADKSKYNFGTMCYREKDTTGVRQRCDGLNGMDVVDDDPNMCNKYGLNAGDSTKCCMEKGLTASLGDSHYICSKDGFGLTAELPTDFGDCASECVEGAGTTMEGTSSSDALAAGIGGIAMLAVTFMA